MKLNRFVISLAMLTCSMHVMAGDSLEVQQTKFEKRLERKQNAWLSLIPTHFVIQNAGNMGTLSAGIGWSYGKSRKWETELLVGFIPKHDSSRPKITTTLKGNYIPWKIDLSKISGKIPEDRWRFCPLTASLYVNTVYGHEFWKSQPGRYPDGYYQFMSTKFRLNIALGERIEFKIPESKRKRHSRIALFYEFSTCDLYVRSMFQSSDVKLKDIIGLSIGAKFYTN